VNSDFDDEENSREAAVADKSGEGKKMFPNLKSDEFTREAIGEKAGVTNGKHLAENNSDTNT